MFELAGPVVQGLLRHMEWADARMWNSLLGLPAAQVEPGLLERLHHLHSVQWVYLKIWRGEPVRIPELSGFGNLDSLNAWVRAYCRDLPRFLEDLQDATLARTIEFPWADQVAQRCGTAESSTVGESILQVVLHTTHHRGQVSARIRELGHEPPLIDFIAWIWMGRPQAQWTSGDSAA